MTIKFSGCTRKTLIISQIVGKYLHKQYKCNDCGRTSFEQKRIITKEDLLTPLSEFEKAEGITETRDDTKPIYFDYLKDPENLIFEY